MGLMENLGRVATSYMDEKAKLQEAGEKRKRTRMGHGFWPHEVCLLYTSDAADE